MVPSEFNFGEIVKIFVGNPHRPDVFIGMLNSKMEDSLVVENVIHLNSDQKIKRLIFIVDPDIRCMDVPTDVEVSDWMDLVSSTCVKYSEKKN